MLNSFAGLIKFSASDWYVPRPRLTTSTALGVEQIRRFDDFTAWNVGATYALTRHVGLDLRYHDTDAQPRQPAAPEQLARGTEWPVTAWDHRLILADGVPDPDSRQAPYDAYDRQTAEGVALLGELQTLRFDPDMPRPANFSR